MSGLAQKLRYIATPPAKTGTHIVQTVATGAAAASFDWVAGLGADAPKGKCWMRLEPLAQPVYVRFGPTSTTGTTTANGWHLAAGEDEHWYVDPVKDRYIDFIAGGVGTMKVQVCSPIGERRDV